MKVTSSLTLGLTPWVEVHNLLLAGTRNTNKTLRHPHLRNSQETPQYFLPVVTDNRENLLYQALSLPFSYVSTFGPTWFSHAEKTRYISDDHRSHVVVCFGDKVVGAVTWSSGRTPGFHQVDLISCDDDAWTPSLVQASLEEAMSLIIRASEVARVQLLFGTYNETVLDYLLSTDRFEIEGVLRERFFLDGRYWPGVMTCASVEAFRPESAPSDAAHASRLSRLHEKALNDISSRKIDLAGDSSS